MGVFGSGDKTSSSADNRVGASDAAIVGQSGAGIFFGSSNAKPASEAVQVVSNAWPIVLILGVVLVIVTFFRRGGHG